MLVNPDGEPRNINLLIFLYWLLYKKYEIAIPPTECPIKIEGLYWPQTTPINFEYSIALKLLFPENPCPGPSNETMLYPNLANLRIRFFHRPELLCHPCANSMVSFGPDQ